MKKYLSLLLSLTVLAVGLSVPFSVNADTPVTTTYEDLEDFDTYNTSTSRPSASGKIINTVAGATKMVALEESANYVEKTFTDLYSASSYKFFGNSPASLNYGVSFANSTISTKSVQSKTKLNGTSTLTDFTAKFTVTATQTNKSLWGGAAFRIQDDDFCTSKATFGTKGYMLLLESSTTSCDVKVTLRHYKTSGSASAAVIGSATTLSGLLSNAANGVAVTLTVKGNSVTAVIADALSDNSKTLTYTLPNTSSAEYFNKGSFAFVGNGYHDITNISLKGMVCENEIQREIKFENTLSADSYTVYGSQGNSENNYGAVFKNDSIQNNGDCKFLYKGKQSVENFKADFCITKVSTTALYGGIAFHVPDSEFTKATFGTAGYLLFVDSPEGSMDVSVKLRNYSTGSVKSEILLGTAEGLLSAPSDGVRMEVFVIGNTGKVTIHDALFDERKAEYDFTLYSSNASAGNFGSGSIALVAHAVHSFTNVNISELKTSLPYVNVENFKVQADFTLPDVTSLQGGLAFYIQDANNLSPGLSGYAINLVHTSNTGDNNLSLQLLRYGTNADGTKNVNLGAMATQKATGFLDNANGKGEKIRLHIEVIRGQITYYAENITNGKTSTVFKTSATANSTSPSVTYNFTYNSGAVGYFTNCSGIKLSNLQITPLSDCKVSFAEVEGGTAQGGGVYTYGESVTVKALSNDGYCFTGWSDGEKILETSDTYTFTVTEDTLLIPTYKLLPLRYAGYDEDSDCAVVVIENIDEVEKIGCDFSLIYENSTADFSVSTAYVNKNALGKQPFIVTDSGVYYCDTDANGEIDSNDIVTLKKQLIGSSTAYKDTADLNNDNSKDLLDLVKMKKVMCEKSYTLPEYQNTYVYAFKCGFSEIKDTFYVGIAPFAESENTSFGATYYLKFEGGKKMSESISANHTPFGKIRIACVGDSITQGVGATNWNSGDKSYAYPARLNTLLGDGVTVENFGRGGSYVYYKSSRDATLWYPNTIEYENSNAFDSDIVIIKLGTNDARAVLNDTDAAAWEQQFTDLIEHYQSLPSHPKVYVVSCLTLKPYTEKQNEGKEESKKVDFEGNLVNYILPRQKSVAESHGCVYIDAYTDLYDGCINGNVLSPNDRLHPRDEGYQIMAEYIAPYIDLDILF